MKLVKIEFRNIASYGNKLQTLEFDSNGKLILLQGKSGDGKSTLLNLPSLLFYGKITKRSKKEICNRINKNGYIKGTVISQDHEFVIERKFSPNSVKVYKDGVDLDTIGVKDAQNYIDENIVQMPQEIFNNVVSLSMSKFKSFLNMTPEDRRQIIDRVFNLEIVNTIFNQIKKEIRETGLAINSDNQQIYTLGETINKANAELVKLNANNNNFNNVKIEENNALIEKETANIQAYSAKYQEFSETYNAASTNYQNALTEVQRLNMYIGTIEEKLNLFNQGQCPTCGTSFANDTFASIKTELQNKHKTSKELLETATQNQNSQFQLLQQYSTALQTLNNAIHTSQYNINTAQANNAILNEAMQHNNEYSSIQNIIASNTESLNLAKTHLISDTAHMDNLTILSSLYSTEGVKKIILRDYIPHLNQEINKSLAEMEFPYRLQFDESFDGKLYYLSQEIGADTISDGEHKRVDLAVLCSIFKLLKRKYPSINFFSLDEVLGSQDPLTASQILSFLKEYAKELKLNLFVACHVEMEESYFDESIKVFKEMGFSDLHYNKKLN